VRILLVAATAPEIAPVVATLGPDVPSGNRTLTFMWHGHQIDVLTTGVGMVATAARCASAMARVRYDVAINAGVAGSFVPNLTPGTVVQVTRDRLPELGAEDGEAFLTIHDLGLLGLNETPFRAGMLVNAAPPQAPVLATIPSVTGVTVNTVHGNTASIALVVERHSPDVETMEGAAFMYAALMHEVAFVQLRAISNMVERRNRSAWKLPEAIAALTAVTTTLIEQL
jgi:futalosine hydrolase